MGAKSISICLDCLRGGGELLVCFLGLWDHTAIGSNFMYVFVIFKKVSVRGLCSTWQCGNCGVDCLTSRSPTSPGPQSSHPSVLAASALGGAKGLSL